MSDLPPPTDHTLEVQRLFVQHQQLVLYYVLSIEPNLGDAQDILQETFLAVSRKAQTYTLGTNFPAWACTVARYQALQFQRSLQRRTARLDEDVLEMLHGGDSPIPESMERRTRALKDCLEKLAPKALELIRLRYHLGQLPETIASTVGWTPNSVRVALARARQTLRTCVDRSHHTMDLS
jgi:RNA polymerase sigma-70 factor (ECF subfamily)